MKMKNALKQNILEATGGRTLLMTPKEFVELAEKSPSEILRSTVLPPQIGSSGYGKILVEVRTPRFHIKHG